MNKEFRNKYDFRKEVKEERAEKSRCLIRIFRICSEESV